MNKVYYFAYGSNMSIDRLEERVGRVRRIGVRELKGFELKFNYGNFFESFANLVLNANKSVTGILYEITENQLEILDYFEGAHMPHLCYYRLATTINGLKCYCYISFNIRKEFKKPVRYSYLRHIIQGYKENNLNFNLKVK